MTELQNMLSLRRLHWARGQNPDVRLGIAGPYLCHCGNVQEDDYSVSRRDMLPFLHLTTRPHRALLPTLLTQLTPLTIFWALEQKWNGSDDTPLQLLAHLRC